MLTAVSILLMALAALLLLPVAVLTIEIVAAAPRFSRHGTKAPIDHSRANSLAVLVPAHNESSGLIPTLQDVRRELRIGDRLLVVADNCTDDTAAVAASAGAEVTVRNDPNRIGKGYALDWGLRHLKENPPATVIIIDADCRLGPGAIDTLATACESTGRPAQALYMMSAPFGVPASAQVAEFAWRVKNFVRPLGLLSLGLPCQMMGTGMALPWRALEGIKLASGHIVEDLKLGLDLTLAGFSPLFCPSATVTSQFPQTAKGLETQRQRWEKGHLATILSEVPRLLYFAVTRRNSMLLALALDMAVPPLAVSGLLLMGVTAVAAIAAMTGASSAALWISFAGLSCFSLCMFWAWRLCGRDILPPGRLLLVGAYICGKLPLYGRMLLGKSATHWVRTDRSQTPDP